MMLNTSAKGPVDPFEAALNSPTNMLEDTNYTFPESEITGGKSNEENGVYAEASSGDGGGPRMLPEAEGARQQKGSWKKEEDALLLGYVNKYGARQWHLVQEKTGLARSGKSCRLRWFDHLRPGLKKCSFTPEEQEKLIELHAKYGNRWSTIAKHMEGRTDNQVKNYWNTRTRRCQRTEQPIYPPHVLPTTRSSTEDNHNVIQQPRYEITMRADGQDDIPMVFFDFRKYPPQLSSFPRLPGSPSSSVEFHPPQSCQGLASCSRRRLQLQHHDRPNIEGSHDNTAADPTTNSNSGQQVIADGVNFSAPRPINNLGPEMSELPSFQNPRCRPDEPVCAPASASVEQGGFLPPLANDSMASVPNTIGQDETDWNLFLIATSPDRYSLTSRYTSDLDNCTPSDLADSIPIGSLWSDCPDEDIFSGLDPIYPQK